MVVSSTGEKKLIIIAVSMSHHPVEKVLANFTKSLHSFLFPFLLNVWMHNFLFISWLIKTTRISSYLKIIMDSLFYHQPPETTIKFNLQDTGAPYTANSRKILVLYIGTKFLWINFPFYSCVIACRAFPSFPLSLNYILILL